MISVIVPTFNRSESLLVAINSILKTKNLNIEIVIVDDASEDDTQKKINLLNNKKIKYIRNDKNIGTAKSKLKGIEIAEGDYIGLERDTTCIDYVTAANTFWDALDTLNA